jgi:hypothetical protein
VKKIYFAVIASVLAIAVVIGVSRLRAHAGATPGILLSQLAGSFAGQGASNYALCFNKTFTAVQACSITPGSQVVPWLLNSTNQVTVDTKGNSCGEVIDANAPTFPGPFAAGGDDDIIVGVTTSYNPATSSGNTSFKEYVAGPGVSCIGAVFVNRAKAPVFLTGTEHFVVSENGDRVDAIILTVHTTSPVDFVAGYVGHGFSQRQTS